MPPIDTIKHWAEYMKTHAEWKKQHTAFINAQFDKAYQFIERIKKQKRGREKIIKLYNIKNTKGYETLLK